jgi:hypothetical protein
MTTLPNDWFNPVVGFIKVNLWHGGEMPVEEGTRVLVVHRDGEIHITLAGCFGDHAREWDHDNYPGDIIAWAPAPLSFDPSIND